jgi:tetratricopeptide (TPR) repeat protein
LIQGLSLYHGCQSKNSFDCIEELKNKGILNGKAAEKIRQALRESMTWHMRCQFYQNKGQTTCYYHKGPVSQEEPIFFINDKEFQAIQGIDHVLHPFCEAIKLFLQGNEQIFKRAPCYMNKGSASLPPHSPHAFVPTSHACEVICLQSHAEEFGSFIRNGELEKSFPHYYHHYLIDLKIEYAKTMHKYGEKPNQETYKMLCKLGTVYAFSNDMKSSLKCLKQAHTLFEKLNSLEIIPEPVVGVEKFGQQEKESRVSVILYNNLGIVCLIMKEPEAVQHLERSISLCSKFAKEDLNLLAKCYFNLACAYHSEKKFDKAISCLEKVLPLLTKSVKDSFDLSIPLCKMRMGMSYHKLGNYAQASKHFIEALKIYKKTYGQHPHTDISYVMEQLARTSFMQNKQVEAERYFKDAWDQLWRVYNQKPHVALASFLYQRGCFWEELHNREHAIDCYEKAVKNNGMIEGQHSSLLNATILQRQGSLLLQLEQNHSAIECFEKLLKIQSEIFGSHPDASICSTLISLGQSYERVEDFEKSLLCFFKAAKMCQQSNPKDDRLRNILCRIDAIYATLQKLHHVSPSSHLAIEIYQSHYKGHFQLFAEMLELFASAWASCNEATKAIFYYRQLDELYRAHSIHSQGKILDIQNQLTLQEKR